MYACCVHIATTAPPFLASIVSLSLQFSRRKFCFLTVMPSAEREGAAAPAKPDSANLFKKRKTLGEAAEKITTLKPGSIVVCSEFEQKGVQLFYRNS